MTKGTSAGYGDARANLECIATPVHDKLWRPRAPFNPITSERPRASVAEVYLSAVSDNG
jgi:hypothetical protein